MHSNHAAQLADDSDDNDKLLRLSRALEHLSCFLSDEYAPQLGSHGFTERAEHLDKELTRFYAHSIPYNAALHEPEALRRTYDRALTSMARICGKLYRHVHEECSFGEHMPMMQELYTAMQHFQKGARSGLRELKLDYYEFDSLTLELESKLGITSPEHANGNGHDGENGHKKDRRRRLPKDPNRIELELRKCVEVAEQIRPKITADKKQEKLDRILGDVKSILSNLPEGDDDTSKGARIAALTSASAKILKVSKWIRKVDLLADERSESAKREILRRFSDLSSLSHGQQPQNGNHF